VEIVLFTYKNKTYEGSENIVDTHFPVVSGKESTNNTLKRMHNAISNQKRKLLGINHMGTYKYLQNYLNEFIYKLNRRYFGDRLFDRLIISGIYPYVQ